MITLHVKAGVRYWEDATINNVEDTEDGSLIPCKEGDLWCPIIDVDSGKILNWRIGTTARIHYKVCDNGCYTLMDNDLVIAMIEDDYVPKCMCPKENGYGDYIIMDINADGVISNWNADFADFPDPS